MKPEEQPIIWSNKDIGFAALALLGAFGVFAFIGKIYLNSQAPTDPVFCCEVYKPGCYVNTTDTWCPKDLKPQASAYCFGQADWCFCFKDLKECKVNLLRVRSFSPFIDEEVKCTKQP